MKSKITYNEIKPPAATEVEAHILGAILQDAAAIEEAIKLIKVEYFFLKAHQLIYRAMLEMFNSSLPIDTITVYEELKKRELAEEAGGASYLAKLIQHTTTSATIEYHCRIVIEKWILRNMISLSHTIAKKAYSEADDVFELLSTAVRDYEEIIETVQSGREEVNFYDKLYSIIDRIEQERKQVEEGNELTIKSSDFPSFNKATGGIRNTNIIVISGNYKKGKTTLATALVKDFVINKKIPTGIISLEMEEYENDMKILSLSCGIRYGYLRDPGQKNRHNEYLLSDEMIRQMYFDALDKFKDTKLLICDEVLDETQIKAKLKYWKRKHGIRLAVIDYIGLVNTNRRFERRDLEVAHISRFLKLTAKELGIPLIILSQENEEGNVAESKGLVRDADFWFSISHPVDEKKEQVEINGEKVRVDQSHYLVTFKGSRHSPNGGQFLCIYQPDGRFVEAYTHQIPEII